ncbi:hypothetical protein Tco_1230912 [Tanacetum coccineum]
MQSPFLSNPPESSSQPEGEKTKIDKGKKTMSLKNVEEESTKSDSNDETTHVPSFTVESSKKKELKRRESEIRKEELIDLLDPEVVNKKGLVTLKVYREDDTSKIILEFKASDLHLGEWREVVTAFPNKKVKANKRLKSSVHYKDYPTSTVLNEPILASALQVLRRLKSIFTSVYAVVQKLKKDSWKELQFSLLNNSKLNVKVYKAGKRLLYVKRNKAISLEKTTSKVGIEVQQLFLKGLYLRISSKEITPQLSFNHLAIPQASIEPQFENIIKNGPFIPMTAGQRKLEGQWTRDERKTTNLDQRLKSLIMSVLPDDQMNSIINCLTAKST